MGGLLRRRKFIGQCRPADAVDREHIHPVGGNCRFTLQRRANGAPASAFHTAMFCLVSAGSSAVFCVTWRTASAAKGLTVDRDPKSKIVLSRHTESLGLSRIGTNTQLVDRDMQVQSEDDVPDDPRKKICPCMCEHHWPQRFAEFCHDAKNHSQAKND